MEKETIKVPRKWLERLVELNNNCKYTGQTEQKHKEAVSLLHGYVESAELLLQ